MARANNTTACRIHMNKYKIAVRVLLILLVCPIALPFLLFVIRHEKFWKFFCIVWLIQFLLGSLLILSLFFHNWFFDQGFRRMHYLQTYHKDKIRVVEDSDFRFYEEGYTVSYRLNSKYSVAHRILLMPESKSVPIDYEFDGELLIEIYDINDGLLKSYKVIQSDNILREGDEDSFKDYIPYIGLYSSRSSSVFAFELGEIPFSIIRPRRGKLENLEIKITVLKPDEKLKEYCDKATIIIIPDLRM